jgi:phosphoserine phosphatase
MEKLLHGLLARDEQHLESTLKEFREDGPGKLHLLFDYDGTITHEWDENGKPRPSLIGTLREGNYLSEEYSLAAKALADHYKTIEHDHSVEAAVKREKMQEWWKKHYELLIKYRLNRSDIHLAMQNSNVRIRSGMRRILEIAAAAGVPVVIMSANGLGTESIHWHLDRKISLLSPTICSGTVKVI